MNGQEWLWEKKSLNPRSCYRPRPSNSIYYILSIISWWNLNIIIVGLISFTVNAKLGVFKFSLLLILGTNGLPKRVCICVCCGQTRKNNRNDYADCLFVYRGDQYIGMKYRHIAVFILILISWKKCLPFSNN